MSVFGASARDKNQPCLNDCLNRDPNLIELLPDVIDSFRLHPIGLLSDIEKAFLKLNIIPKHRDNLRLFLPTVEEYTGIAEFYLEYVLFHSACIEHLLEPVLTM
ncbi:integrase catalytic domain-containing protein [Trichonephila clavipes]|nr:integrase catalytic domain-containing protein [Trichonephila clavipes]